LASSWTSKPTPVGAPTWWSDQRPPADAHLRGYRGGKIALHRAFRRVTLSPPQLVANLLLMASLTAGWLWMLPVVGRFWVAVFQFWIEKADVEARIKAVPQHLWPAPEFVLPLPYMAAGAIKPALWLSVAVLTLAAIGLTRFLPERHLPLAYGIRAVGIIQVTALVFFAVAPAKFPHDLPTYTLGMLSFGVILIGLAPIILGFTYFIFDFPIWKKACLTLLIMAYLVILVPHQYLAHVYLLQGSILFMPVLYFLLGPFLDVFVFVAFYSWAMSWGAKAD
jgi:hypothetical protein